MGKKEALDSSNDHMSEEDRKRHRLFNPYHNCESARSLDDDGPEIISNRTEKSEFLPTGESVNIVCDDCGCDVMSVSSRSALSQAIGGKVSKLILITDDSAQTIFYCSECKEKHLKASNDNSSNNSGPKKPEKVIYSGGRGRGKKGHH